jgi:predicted kinase
MRQLILLRGTPGCGKSFFVKENGLEAYTICPDDIRLLIQTPVQTLEGNFQISQKNDKKVWDLVLQLLEERMSRGELTIIDATHSRLSLLSKYNKLVDKYRYRVFVVDFSNVPIEVAKQRNAQRPEYKRVPDEIIDMHYARFASQPTPNKYQLITPEEFKEKMVWKEQDFSKYKKIVHIGDIHGCYYPLKEYFKIEPFNDETLYIFIGDYIDRGIENDKVLNFLFSIYEKENVILLEGNHERWIWHWSLDELKSIRSNEFIYNTKPQLDENVDKTIARKFYRKLQQIVVYNYGDKKILVNHAGISKYVTNMIYMPLGAFINGIGDYGDNIDEYWNKNNPENYIQIHGHRNVDEIEMRPYTNTFNLEGKVEFGKKLRILELTEKGFIEKYVLNDVFNQKLHDKFINKRKKIDPNMVMDASNSLEILRSTPKDITEKDLGDGISSFNFSRDVFFDSKWNSINIKARGLFVNNVTGKVVARSYNKFFNVDEMPFTSLKELEKNLVFPVYCYVKENGYLGLASKHPKYDTMFIASKSTDKGYYKTWFEEILMNTIFDTKEFTKYLENTGTTAVFEVMDPENDPHIIDYPDKKIVLLDIIYNTYDFNKFDYDSMIEVANEFNIEHKKLHKVFDNYVEFSDFIRRCAGDMNYKHNGNIIEGFVFEDTTGFMVKKKLPYYNFWKKMRQVKDAMGNGKVVNLAALADVQSNLFYGWMKNNIDRDTAKKLSISELRRRFEEFGKSGVTN